MRKLLAGMIMCAVCAAAAAWGASTIDTNQPTSGADANSTPVVGNFRRAADDINALTARFPASTLTHYIATYGNTSGSLEGTNTSINCLLDSNDTFGMRCTGRNGRLFFFTSDSPTGTLFIENTNTSGNVNETINVYGGLAGGVTLRHRNDGSTQMNGRSSTNSTLSLVNLASAVAPVLRWSSGLTTSEFRQDGSVNAVANNATVGFQWNSLSATADIERIANVGAVRRKTDVTGVQFRYPSTEGTIDDTLVGSGGTRTRRVTGAVTTTNATVTTLAALDLSADTAYDITSKVIGIVSSGTDDGDAVGYTIALTAVREGATTRSAGTTAIGTREESSLSSCAATMDIDDTTDTARVRVTGISGDTIKWRVVMDVVEVAQ